MDNILSMHSWKTNFSVSSVIWRARHFTANRPFELTSGKLVCHRRRCRAKRHWKVQLNSNRRSCWGASWTGWGASWTGLSRHRSESRFIVLAKRFLLYVATELNESTIKMGCGMGVIKYLLFIFNFIFVVSSEREEREGSLWRHNLTKAKRDVSMSFF